MGKITMLYIIGKPSISIRAIYTMAMLIYWRVIDELSLNGWLDIADISEMATWRL